MSPSSEWCVLGSVYGYYRTLIGPRFYFEYTTSSVAEWLACWTQVQKGPGSNRSRDAVG